MELQPPGCEQRGIFAKTMPGDRGCSNARPLHQTERDGAHGQQGGLREFRQIQLFLRAIETQLREVVSKDASGFIEHGPCERFPIIKVAAHAHGLRAMTRKHQCNS